MELQINKNDVKFINSIANNEEVLSLIKNEFSRIDNSSSKKLAKILLTGESSAIEVRQFKSVFESFVKRNVSKFTAVNEGKHDKYYLDDVTLLSLRDNLFKLLEKIGSSIKDLDDDYDSDKWSKSQVDGIEAYEVTKHTTFQDIREKIDKEGKDVCFRYSFKKPDLSVSLFENKVSLQMIDVHVNDNGEYFGFPLKYTYRCPECGAITILNEYEVASAQASKIKCPELLETESEKGESKQKRCNQPLIPDANRTETKDSYIHAISFKDIDGNLLKADAITFTTLPKGHVRVVLQKIPRAYGTQFVHIVDYMPLEKTLFPIPKKVTGEHYLFTLLKSIDDYIEQNTGYQHYGYLAMKMSVIIQFAARYVPGFKYNFHISLSGTMSSGKSQFARYWGLGLYAHDCWSSNATSISIPKLRGTMESFHLFGKDHRYQYRGLLGEKDLIIIDEVKESPDVKNNLKQYSLEPTYEYSKQGSNNQTFERTAQLIVTQNIDTKHLNKYTKDIMKIYTSTESISVSKDDNTPKPAWNYDADLTLPLYSYENKYLRYAIRKVRDDYARNQINWIDGSELALKQRFFFYFYLGSDKTDERLTKVIRENSTRKILSNNIDIIRATGAYNLTEHFKKSAGLVFGSNDLEYFELVDRILTEYEKRTDARTKEMSYALLKLIRIIDGRDYCIAKDLEILQFIIEAVDNKLEVADTAEYKINGHKIIKEDDITDNAITDDTWGYKSNMDDFKT
jgi:hypothetical protein